MKKLFALVFVVLLVCSFGAFKYIKTALFSPLIQTPTTFEIEKGSSAQKTAQMLARQNLAPHPLFARLAMRFYGFDKRLKAGEYLLEQNMSLKDILEKLTSGKVIMHQLTIPEGLTTSKALEIIDQNEFLTGSLPQNISEGALLPETYSFAKGELKENIVKKAQNDMQKTLDNAWENRAENLPLKNKNELLILASIIEKETGVNAERAKVASVFINRLNIDMPLQTDPTVIYALTLGKSELGRSLKHKDLDINSPYNTYLYKGLPPTPICNPGLKAIEAAAKPENTPYLYFVADGLGGHRFAKTLSEHNRNIGLWLKK